jgi:type I restriction enzyme M protein
MADVANWIANARKEMQLSQGDLAERLGVSQPMVSQWEQGKRVPADDVLSKLEKILGARATRTHSQRELRFDAPARTTKKETKVAIESDEARGAKPDRKGKGAKAKNNGSGAVIGFEQTLWEAADKLRGSMDPAEYKHVVLGLIFLKYISDAFEARREELLADKGADPEDRDEYEGYNVFWVPKSARWEELQKAAKQPDIGQRIDRAMESIEKENPTLKGTLPKEFARPQLDKQRLGELIDLLSSVGLREKDHRTKDVLGRVYEYFLAKFASAEGRLGGDFYTPQSVVRVLVEMLEPYKGRVYDPCCGSGGMFVQSEKFAEAHGGRREDIAVFGQEWNATTWRLAKMNLAIRGIEANLGPEWADSFRNDLHKGLKADFVLANPPFNISDWGGEHLREDARWVYGAPPVGNANFAWLQHIAWHLGTNGVAGVVLANGSMSSQQSNEGEIRKKMVEEDLVDCMVALPGQLFYATQIPVCLWFLAKNKGDKRYRERRGEVLFIDARKMGTLVDRTHRELTEEDIAKIARTYHAWRGQKEQGAYEDVPGFCRGVKKEEIRQHEWVLTPGRYVGAEEAEDDGEPFEVKMKRLVGELEKQFEEGRRLEGVIRANLAGLGYGGG